MAMSSSFDAASLLQATLYPENVGWRDATIVGQEAANPLVGSSLVLRYDDSLELQVDQQAYPSERSWQGSTQTCRSTRAGLPTAMTLEGRSLTHYRARAHDGVVADSRTTAIDDASTEPRVCLRS
jgi:hypothetical protein